MPELRTPVAPEEWLFRRGYATPEKNYLNPDGSATSRVYKLREKDNGELSVDIKSMTTPLQAVSDASRFMLFEIANNDVLEVGLSTYHDPLTPDVNGVDNPAHAVIIGLSMNDDVLPGILARKSRRVHLNLPI